MTSLRQLNPGARFKLLGRTGTLLSVNESRAYVKLDTHQEKHFPTRTGKEVHITKTSEEVSWAPGTEVTPILEKGERDAKKVKGEASQGAGKREVESGGAMPSNRTASQSTPDVLRGLQDVDGGRMIPTEEQMAIVDAFARGASIVVEAGAGAAKTTTCKLIADAIAPKRGTYIVFNKSMATEAATKMPASVACSTIHSLAFRAVGKHYAHRLQGARMRSDQIAGCLGITPLSVGEGKDQRMLAAGFLAGVTMRSLRRFCFSAEDKPMADHIAYVDGIDMPESDGRRTYRWNNALKTHLLPSLRRAWDDQMSRTGSLTYSHDSYLKTWALSRPAIAGDFVLVDEAQDFSPVMLGLLGHQEAQVALVGDSCQPSGTLVTVVTGAGTRNGKTTHELRPIEALQVGDRVLAWSVSKSHLHELGRKVTGISSRHYVGNLVTVKTQAGQETSYTPDHRVLVHIGDSLVGKHIVYLMRRGYRYRIGRCQWRYGFGSGIYLRTHAEGGDAFWILDVCDTAEDACLREACLSSVSGVPDVTFKKGKTHLLDVEKFWLWLGPNHDRARALCERLGLLVEHPLWEKGNGNLLQRRPLKTRAANLRSGFSMLTIDGARKRRGKKSAKSLWTKVAVSRRAFVGLVWSMDVEDDHTYFGDGILTSNCQQIYEWRGSINALSAMPEAQRFWLSQSFRFGQPIADVANRLLKRLGTSLRLLGRGGPSTTTPPSDPLESPACILTRTNAKAVGLLLQALADKVSVHLVGGGGEVLAFARAAAQLQTGGFVSHPDLACFLNWGAVQEYVEQDPQGEELGMLVRLIDNYGADIVVAAIEQSCRDERGAARVISTAHKAKGREWLSVQIADDFTKPPKDGEVRALNEPELRLAYVACTRGRQHLDVSAVPEFHES